MAFDKNSVSMKRIAPPEQVKFEKGDVYCGELLSIEKVRLKDGGIVSRYIMRDMETGKKFRFIGTTQLDETLSPDEVGYYLEIAYIGDDANVERNGRKMKVFEVSKSEHPVRQSARTGQQAPDGTFISDEDIPF